MIKNNQLEEKGKTWVWTNNNPIKTIIISAVFIRFFIIILYQHITIYPDSYDYLYLAELLRLFDLSGYEGQRSPGYPILLAIADNGYLTIVILQLLIGIGTLIFVYETLLLLRIKKELSLLITILISIYIPIIFFELAVLSETLTLFVITVIAYLLFNVLSKKEDRWQDYIWLGLLCGYLVLIKPFYVFLGILLFIILFIKSRKTKHYLTRYLLLAVLPLIAYFGWSYVNKVNTGYFVPTTYYGYNVAQNCVWFAEKTTTEYQDIGNIYAYYRIHETSDKEIAMTLWEAYPKLREETGLSFTDLSKELYDYSIATIKKNPTDYMKQVLISWRDFWKTSMYWEPHGAAIHFADKVILYIGYAERIIMQLVKILFVFLIPYNIFQAFRRRQINPQQIISIVIFTASILQALTTYGTNSRFSFPFEILIVISVLLNILEWKKLKEKLHPDNQNATQI